MRVYTTGATPLDDGSVDAYLNAHMSAARLLSKCVDPQRKVEYWKCSLDRYKWLVKRAPAITKDLLEEERVFERELAMAAQMVELLPTKIDRMHFLGQDTGELS